MREHKLLKIVSGGQTGVDRAALDVALERAIAYGGWCPQGGWAEDAQDPPGVLALYAGLRETPDADPRQRTVWNVRDSDRLLVLVDSFGLAGSKGSALALATAEALAKPHRVVDLDQGERIAQALAWLADPPTSTEERGGGFALCIAGPRESEAPGIYAKAGEFLRAMLTRL